MTKQDTGDSQDARTYGDIGTNLLMENEQVRVWELHLEPGASSDLHHHANDYIMVQIEGDKIAARFEADSEGTFAGADYIEGDVVPGLAIFAEAGGRETAVNVGEKAFREVVVEVKAKRRPGVLPVQHVALSVTDLDAALPFYTEALGLELLPRPDFGIPGAWLGSGNGVQVHLIEDPSFVASAGHHLAFETADLAAEKARLEGLGVEVGDGFGMNGVQQAFFADPSGNTFELNQPSASPH